MRQPRLASVIERRILVNYRIDPAIIAPMLPAPLRPQEVSGWAVAGICLIRLGKVRPSWVPLKENLWKEAGVSRATMNRATEILADWNTRITACDGFTPREARKNDEIATLRAALAAKTRECTELARRLDAAATAIAALHHDNTLLRQELDHRGQVVGLSSRA
jgi:hypothetical protein